MTSAVGTPYFVGPEVFFGSYGKECDIWSAGVLMYFILSGYLPFRAKTINILIEKITRGDYSF